MRSSNRCSPTSSTDLWLTCRPGCSQQIVRGRCWRRSPTTCSAPPGLCPGRPTRWPAGPPCVVTWSTSRVGSPDPKANERCIYPFTGPGPGTGICCGTACSTTTPDKSPSDPDHPGPQRPYQETTVDTLGQASSSTTPAPWPTRQRHDQPEARSTSQSVHGFRLSRGRCPPVEVEHVVEGLLVGGHVGGHAASFGSSAGGGVDQHGFAYPTEGVEEGFDGEVVAGAAGFEPQQVGELQGENAGEGAV